MNRPPETEVIAAAKSLPLRLRKPFVMLHIQRRTPKEIAAELHISVRCVNYRLTRALRVCRERTEKLT
ncbi:MAG TPA: sigma factor-like helix-turn-helix DNA-binding protein [Steroidobacteraceae bacterium]|nr:sigma factor-like helix-turn-helix DNA-binding protein [Steroidobacteraceae bacterium]